MSIGNAFCFSPLSNRLTSFYLAIVVLLAVLFIGKFLRPALKLRTDVKVQRVTLLLVIVADVVARVIRLGPGQGGAVPVHVRPLLLGPLPARVQFPCALVFFFLPPLPRPGAGRCRVGLAVASTWGGRPPSCSLLLAGVGCMQRCMALAVKP